MTAINVLEDPSSESPQMAFNNGEVSDGAAIMDDSLPSIGGPESTWRVTEWGKTVYLQPTQMTTNDAVYADPNYGDPLYTWDAKDNLTRLSVYSETGPATIATPYVFDLEETNGIARGSGGDLFLTSSTSSPVSMANPLTYSLDMKVNKAVVSNPADGGMAQVFTGFSMVFNLPGTANYNSALPTISALMQISMVSSAGIDSAWDNNEYLNYNDNTITFQYAQPGDPTLPFQATAGGPTELNYNVNDYLDAMIADDQSLPSQATNLGDWSCEGLYIGEEVNYWSEPISVGIQISNLQLQTDPSQSVIYHSPAVPLALFSFTDSSQNAAAVPVVADFYNGPLSFLSHGDAYSYSGSDNVSISSLAASNPLVASGDGDDTLVGSSTGHSYLDAGTGINIDMDGGSRNTTFIQNDYLSGNTWDFIEGFGGNDTDIFFGFISGLSTISVAVGGAGNYRGATVTINPGNGKSEQATFVNVATGLLHGTHAVIDNIPCWIIWM